MRPGDMHDMATTYVRSPVRSATYGVKLHHTDTTPRLDRRGKAKGKDGRDGHAELRMSRNGECTGSATYT